MKYYSNGVGEHIYDKQWWQAEARILGKPVEVELQKREKGGEFYEINEKGQIRRVR